MEKIEILEIIETDEEVEMVDLEVNGNHNFILDNGIITHNSGKSNLIYYLIKKLRKTYSFNLVTFGLKFETKDTKTINSLEELESLRNSLVFLDEFFTLFDLEDRKKKRQIEKTLRLIFHNNNILVLVGVPENFKKFISSKISTCFYKKVNMRDFINGSSVKSKLVAYEGVGMGNETLNLRMGEVLVFNEDYKIFNVPYLKEFDSKKNNKDIFEKKCGKIKSAKKVGDVPDIES